MKKSFKLDFLVIVSILLLIHISFTLKHAGNDASEQESQNGFAVIEQQNEKCESVIRGLMKNIKDEKPKLPPKHDYQKENKLVDKQIEFGGLFLQTIKIAIKECTYYPQSKFYDFAKSIFGDDAAEDRRCISPFAKVFL